MTFPCYPEYKESGVEWLGLVPAAWRVVRTFHLGVCIRTGKVDVNIQEEDGIYPFFTCSKDAKKARQFSFDCEALLVAGNGEVGYTQYYKGKFEAYQRTYVLSDFGDMNARFLQYHYMENLVVSVKGKSIGSVIQFITLNDLRDFPVPIPSQSEQTQIARFLDHETARIDALIEEQQRLIELLKEKRQAVISHAVTKGLDPTVPMKDSGVEWLGEVPSHWVVSRAKLVSDIFVPQRNKPELNDSEGVAWVTMEDMNGGYISATNLKVTELAADEAGSKVLKKGAVIASCVGRFGIVAINAVDVVINQQLQAFEPRKIKAEYLKNIVSLSKEYFELIGTAATLVYVNQQGFENLPVLIPSRSEQESICLYVDEANSRFDALLSQSLESIQLLQERRSALISAAVTGKIDVRGWQPPASASTPELALEAV